MRQAATLPPWAERPTRGGRAAKAVTLTLIVLAILAPLYVVVLTSLSTQEAITRAGGLVLVPDGISFEAYRELLSGGVVTRAALVSLGVTAVGTLISLTVTTLAAYGLSRPGSLWHRPLLIMVLLTFLFAPGIIPVYLVVQATGLLNTYWSLILPGAVWAFNLIVLRAFFMNLPRELLDSARVDGASEWRILLRIVLPLSRAAVAVIGLFYAVGYWNAFFNALLYLDDSSMWPLQLVLRTYVLEGTAIPGGPTDPGAGFGVAPSLAVKMAIVVLALLPVLCAYPFVQRHFTKGVLTGAVKG